ncbi:transcriptional regulator BetI [Marinobacter sp. CHS3-4]|uniref:transcriptional regulator BetI n=1 Tax=Marinobacter sp. CHS3-4 TaxID=3045174 RepID=UPI0024B5BAC3|nr:transcriptional regulator BetI [Marinobacter sp. CHS3-4]MDI9246448.1 transcriptional regulator BetI [Marinobacter sp. CHS3-4]
MRRISIGSIRRQELINAALEVIEQHGFHAATVGKISQVSGLSVGIVSHYFGGKQGLLEAAMRHLLSLLQQELIGSIKKMPNDPCLRLMAIVDVNFSGQQTVGKSAKTWVAFWSQAMYSPALARLQRVNELRLFSNLKYYLRQIVPDDQVTATAHTVAALIDGFWLRAALSEGRLDSDKAAALCKTYIEQTIQRAKMAEL